MSETVSSGERDHDRDNDHDESDPVSIEVIVANNPLPENEYPDNAPRVEDTHLSLAAKPRLLHSVDELRSLMRESRQMTGFSNFADLSTPRNSARSPNFPTFTRFSSTRFANAEMATYTVMETDQPDTNALFDMVYPISLVVTDSRKITLPGLPLKGITDSKGYPLLYDLELPRKILKARSSGALYPANLSRALASKMTTVPDNHMTRTWAHMFLLTNEKDAQSIIMQRVMGSGAGDNHIALLLKAYLAYFDSIVGALDGVIPARQPFSPAVTVINATTQDGWASQVLGSSAEIVNVLGGASGYQEFWAHCCFDQPPIYAAKTSPDGRMASSLFSHYQLGYGMSMVCICDWDAYSNLRVPSFFAKPNLILGYIETYVQKFGLQEQANEALQIAMLWPTLVQLEANITLPKPHHAADWLGAEIERPVIETSYSGLIASSPFVILASTLAGAWAMRSQIYDYLTLLASKRNTWEMSSQVIKSCVSWLVTNASAPGVGWDFLLRHQFHITPSFLYLTGLAVETVDWANLLAGFTWKESQFPAHLRLLQPFWVNTSVCCGLPWEVAWTPQVEMSGNMLTADPATIMRMLRLGLISGISGSNQRSDYEVGIYPILDHVGNDTIELRSHLPVQLQTVLQHGVRVLALCSRPDSYESRLSLTSRDPADSRQTRESWSLGGLLQHLSLQDRGGDAMSAGKVFHRNPGMASPDTVTAAKARLTSVKMRLAKMAMDAAAEAGSLLVAKGAGFYNATPCDSAPQPGQVEVLYSPHTSGDCGWWCVLYLIRGLNHDQHSMACLRERVACAAGKDTARLGTLSLEEMAGVCAVLQLPVPLIYSGTKCMVLSGGGSDNSAPDEKNLQLALTMLRLADNHWELVKRTDTDNVTNDQDDYVHADTGNMPEHCPGWDPSIQESQSPKEQVTEPDTEARPELPHNLATKVRVLDTMIQRWDNRVASTDEVVRMHQKVFPNAGIPRFVRERDNRERRGEAPCQDIRTPQTLQGTKTVIQQFLTKQCGPVYEASLSKFVHTYAGQQAKCAERWPHRSPETADKNNLSLADLLMCPLNVKVPQEAVAVWFIKTHQDNHTEFVTSVGLWLAAVDLCNFAWAELLSSGLLEKNEDTWLEHAKQLHDDWRKSGLEMCSCDSCWAQMLYTQSLWGRGGVQVDWEKEVTSKASVPDDILAYTGQVWSAEYASQIIRETVREVLSTATERAVFCSFDDFMDQAYEWLVTGSAAGMPSAFKGTDIRKTLRSKYKIAPRATKRSVMEKIPREHILMQLQSRPQTIAKLHQKLNETGGKARAIYGVTLWHYIFSNWLMAPFEKAIDHKHIDINIRNDRFLAIQVRRAQQANQGACFSSYDYPDFNSMHTHYHMSMIYEEAATVARASKAVMNMAHDEADLLMQGYKWLEKSVYTQACYLPGADDFIQTVGGLYSGNRDTTLINTILNIAYAKVVDRSCMNMGLNPTVIWRLCHGDDIITLHEKYGAALAWNAVAAKANLKGQEKKLLTDRSYHEYLRVMGCNDGKLRGSLARVAATFVNGNWETGHTGGAHANLVELQATLRVLERRGMRTSFSKKLRAASIKRLTNRIRDFDDDKDLLEDVLISIADIDQDADAKKGLGHGKKENKSLDGPENEASGGGMEAIYAEVELREKDEIEQLFKELPDEVTRPYQQMLVASLPFQLQQQDYLGSRLKRLLQKSTYGSEMPRNLQVETKQTPQLLAYHDKLKMTRVKRGKHVRRIDMADVDKIVGKYKVFATTVRRIKAFYMVLSALDNLGGYSKSDLLAHLCKMPEAVVRDVLVTEGLLTSDWRRMDRPSAAEVGALENEIEMYLTGDGIIHIDEEVVIYTADGRHNQVPVRDLMLY